MTGYTDSDLWEQDDATTVASAAKRSIKWRDANPGCKVFHNDHRILSFEWRDNQIVIRYVMARDPNGRIWEFVVPKENEAFIIDAIEAGILKEGAILWIDIESNGAKQDRWIGITVK